MPPIKSFKANPKRAMTLSLEVTRDCVSKGCYTALLTQTIIRCHFDGKINKSSFPLIAENLGKSKEYVQARINECVRLGLMEKRRNGWYFAIGAKRWNQIHGYMHSKMVAIPKSALSSTSNFKTFIRSIQILMAEMKAANLQRQLGKAPQVRSTPLSISYISNFTGLSTRTVSSVKKTASELGYVTFQRNYIPVDSGSTAKVHQWRLHKEPEQRIVRTGPDSFILCYDDTASCTPLLKMKRRKHKFSEEEKKEIRRRFILFENNLKRFGKQQPAEFKGQLVLTEQDIINKKTRKNQPRKCSLAITQDNSQVAKVCKPISMSYDSCLASPLLS